VRLSTLDFLDALPPEERVVMNSGWSVRLRCPFHEEHLRSAFRHVVSRHDALCEAFPIANGRRRTIRISPSAVGDNVEIGNVDARQIATVVEDSYHRPFRLDEGPLAGLRVFIVDAGDWVLQLRIHHLIADLWSEAIFLDELLGEYARRLGHAASGDAARPKQFIDFERYEASDPTLARTRKRQARWLARYDLHPAFPATSGRIARSSTLRLDRQVVKKMRVMAAANGCTMFEVALSLFCLLLWLSFGLEQTTIAVPTANRWPPFMSTVGWLARITAVEAVIEGTETWAQNLQRLRASARKGAERGGIEAGKWLGMNGQLPSFNFFSLAAATDVDLTPWAASLWDGIHGNCHGLEISSVSVKRRFDTYPVRMFMAPWAGQLLTTIVANSELFSEAEVQFLIARYVELVRLALDRPDAPVDTFRSLVPADPREDILDA
jgi:hypothetical protein